MIRSALPTAALALAAAGLLAACDNKREAEAKVGGAEAEVSTTLPESQVTDQQLQNTAEGAAAAAATAQGSATSVVVSPPATGEAAPAAPPADGAPAPAPK
jgi:hypothetical protein